VIFSDDVANEIKKKGYPAYDELVKLLGKEILSGDGEIDKAKMAAAIFNDKDSLEKVNNILHPAVNTYIINIIGNERKRNVYDFVFVEAALLIENGYDKIVDELWYVYASEEARRERLKASRGYSDAKITDILANQLSDEVFREYCSFVIDNSTDLSDAAKQIDNKLWEWRK
jgi:dephospho-CoA kinase